MNISTVPMVLWEAQYGHLDFPYHILPKKMQISNQVQRREKCNYIKTVKVGENEVVNTKSIQTT
jgi:hypothetical protein